MKSLLHVVILGAALAAAACGGAEIRLNDEGNRAFAEEDFDEAIRSYKQAEVEASDVPEPYYNAANAFHRKGELDDAQEHMEHALKTADGEMEESGLFNLGNNHYDQGLFEDAIEAYKETLRLDPDAQDAKYNLELALRQLDEQEMAGGARDPAPSGSGPQGQDSQPQQGEDEEQLGQTPEDERDESVGLTEEQAKQLLEAVSQDTQTIQQFQQQRQDTNPRRPAQDW